METVSKNRLRKSKAISVCRTDEVYVGLDVHKLTVHAAVWMNGKIRKTWSMPAEVGVVVRTLKPLAPGLKRIVYEAGPTGYSLARALRAASLPAWVIAPGATPRPSARENKSDRLDCRKLAEYAAAGLLRPTAIPTPEEEAKRQVVRLREQLIGKRRRVKQQIKSFLLQHGITAPEGMAGAYWRKDALAYLHRLRLRANLRFCLDRLLEELAHLEQQVKRTNGQLEAMTRRRADAERVRRLRTHPGVGPLVATSFLTELYQPARFESPRQVGRYLGLAPQVRQSGEARWEGPILKTGRASLRSLLIEAAWQWIRRDPAATAIYRRLVGNTGQGKKAIVAMARRLAINLWMMLIKEEDYRSPAPAASG